MGNFRPSGRGGFDRNRSSGNRFNDRSSGFSGRARGGFDRPVEMHDVTCDKCGKECQVPFRPSGDKPVLCSDCFRQKDTSRSFSPRDSNREGSGSPGVSSQQINQINAKLDKILSVLQELEVVADDNESGDEAEEKSDETEAESDKPEEDSDELDTEK